MSLEARYNKHHSPETIQTIQNLERLEQIASAAGHGYTSVRPNVNAGWTNVEFEEENCRPSYDLNHIKTFSPDVIKALLFELSESRKALAAIPDLLRDDEESFQEFDALTANIPTV